MTNARSYDPGDYCWNGTVSPSWIETYYGWLDNQWEEDHTINCKRHLQGEDGTNPHYYLGNYYNVGASVAQEDTSTIISEHRYSTSICPAGWQLPDNIGDRSFQNLVDKSKTEGNIEITAGEDGTIHKSPYWFTYNGYISSQGIRWYANIAYYWSSTAQTSSSWYHFYANGDGRLTPANGGGTRHGGLGLRCVARQ